MFPVMFPIDQLKLLAMFADKVIPVDVPLHIPFVALVVTAGNGFTVTVMVYGLPTQPAGDAGTTIY